MQRIRDLVERGRLGIGDIQIAEVLRWVLQRARGDSSLADLCGALEAAARLALLKARHLDGVWRSDDEEEDRPWLGPPPELPLRRSWIGERIAIGPLSFLAGARTSEHDSLRSPIALAAIAPHDLRGAMLAVLGRQRRPPPPVAERRAPRVSTEMCSAMILQRVQEHGEVRLHGLAGESRDAHVAAFLSCLTLARQGAVSLVQEDLFGDIFVRPAAEVMSATA